VFRRTPVHRLERVEVGEDETEVALESVCSRELAAERLLDCAPVREPCQPVDQGLPFDDPVQTRVLECDHGVGDERCHRLASAVVEALTGEDNPAEVLLPDSERQLEQSRAGLRITGACKLAFRADHNPSVGTGRFNRGLDHHAQELIDVVGGGQHLGKAGRRIPSSPALVLELGEPLLELGRHAIERLGDLRELVRPVDFEPFLEPPVGDRVCSVCQPTQRANNRPAGEHACDREDQEGCEQCGCFEPVDSPRNREQRDDNEGRNEFEPETSDHRKPRIRRKSVSVNHPSYSLSVVRV